MPNQKTMVRAKLVRFTFPVPKDRQSSTHEWSNKTVDNLVVFPDARLARCTLRGNENFPIVATFHYYEAASLEEQLAWEGEPEFKCETCGQTFENSQGLGKHRVTKHPEVTGK